MISWHIDGFRRLRWFIYMYAQQELRFSQYQQSIALNSRIY